VSGKINPWIHDISESNEIASGEVLGGEDPKTTVWDCGIRQVKHAFFFQ
jgi:hypothetical protein